MGKVYLSKPDGTVEGFENQDVQVAVERLGFTPPDSLSVTDQRGNTIDVPYDAYIRGVDQNAPLQATDQATIDERMESEYLRDETSALGSGVRGFGEELTFGLYEPDERQKRADETHHDTARGIGRFTGAVVPALVPGVGQGKMAQLLGRGAAEGVGLVRGAEAASGASRALRGINDVSHLLPGRATAGLARHTTEALGGGVRGMAAGGAVEAGTSYALRAVLDRDVELSGEGLLGSIALGGALGGAIGAVGKGVAAVERKLAKGASKSVDDGIDDLKRVEAIESNKPVRLTKEELAHGDDILRNATRDMPGFQVTRQASKDISNVAGTVESWRRSPLGSALSVEDRAIIDRGLWSAKQVEKYVRQPTEVQATVMGRLNQHLAEVDNMVGRVLAQPNRGGLDISKLPAPFSPTGLSARAERLGSIDATGLTSVELAARQLGTRLTAGRDTVTNGLRDGMVDNLLSRIPVVGKMMAGRSRDGNGTLRTLLGFELLDNAVESGILGLGAKAAVAVAVAKGVRKLSEKPATTAVVSGLTAENVVRLTGGKSKGEGRPKLARSFANNARAMTPDDASRLAMEQAADVGRVSPSVLASIGATAARRHQLILQGLDGIDPPGQPAYNLRPRDLSAGQVRRIDSMMRVASSPVAFAQMLAAGNLTSEALRLAEGMWPSHVNRARSLAVSWLGTHEGEVPRSVARRLELLLGREAVGSSRDASAVAAQMAIGRQRDRMKAPPGDQAPPSGEAPSDELMSPSDSLSSRPSDS